MTRRKADIIRPDKRIGVRIETLAFLFDVSPQTIENAVAAGKIKPSSDLFGVKLYHVESVERAIFGLSIEETETAELPPSDDPIMKGLNRLDGPKANKRRAAAS